MACFITPLVTGLVLLYLSKIRRYLGGAGFNALILMLLGGSVLLIAEHAWHGEITVYPPFLTAMKSPSDLPTLFYEISVVGGSMTATTSALWALIVSSSRLKLYIASILRYTRIPVATER